MDYIQNSIKQPHPRRKANIFSLLSFSYMLPVFVKGSKQTLTKNDLCDVLPSYKTNKLGDQIEKEWNRVKNKLSILKLILACYRKDILFLGMAELISGTVFIIFQPYALGKIISYFSSNQVNSKTNLYFHTALLIGVNLVKCVYYHNYQLWIKGVSFKMRAAFSSLIYRKALSLSSSSLERSSIGKIVTLLGKDVGCLEHFCFLFSDICVSVLKAAVVSYVMYRKIKTAALVGVGFFLVILPIQVYLGTWTAKLRTRMCRKTDDRLQITQESLSVIKIIKMYTWERHFCDKIMTARKKEIQSMHAIYYLNIIICQIGALSSNIAFYLLIMTYKWLGNQVTAEVLYYVDSCFQVFSYTLGVQFPSSISLTAETVASIRRVREFLQLQEAPPLEYKIPKSSPKIFLKNVDVSVDKQKLLCCVNLSINGGLTIVTGAVASGKSVLLKAILKEYHLLNGEINIEGKLSYASQVPWLFPSSIKQNILFGEKFDDVRYHRVLKVCALHHDINLLPSKDMTIVEDRGINLSKGQQCRINLARAIYKNSDIYLLDDCLSSLDNQVGDFIFQECIKTFLRNKLVVFVTHNIRYLQEAQNVVFVNGKKVTQRSSTVVASKEISGEDTKSFYDFDTVDSSKQVYQEVCQKGGVNCKTYKKYLTFSGGLITLICLLLIYAIAQFVSSYPDKLLSQWVNFEQKISNLTCYNASRTDVEEILELRDSTLQTYTILVLSSTFIDLTVLFVFYKIVRRASINLYKYTITNVINATMHFFDNTFIGNILNRFSQDFISIDDHLPFFFNQMLRILTSTITTMILISTVNTYFLIPSFIFFGLLTLTRRFYLKTSRSLKRLDSSTRSPVIGYFNASLEGLSTLRVLQAQNILKREFDQHQDLYTSAAYMFQCSMKTFAFWLDIFCNIFVIVIIGRFVISDEQFPAGNVGLAISQALKMTAVLQWGVQMWAELENYMTSVERVLEYAEVQKETEQGNGFLPLLKGKIEYDTVFLSYDNKYNVLKNVNFIINPGEKVGIVGRTGAGKSSIISTLFRLYESQGRISIDGVDIKTLALSFLRKQISIIPQDPVLFSGSIRNNIDPEKLYSDDQIWQSLKTVNLETLVFSLDEEINSNFSIGQRQLICIARAIVRNNKIVVLDEVTANIDNETDALIQETIKKVFSGCTVIIIAHKLSSVLDLDKILVMENGQVLEWDSPSKLLQRKSGYFYTMVQKFKLP